MHGTKITLAGMAAAATMALGASPAAAHISGEPEEVPAGSFTSVTLTVPHGCEGAPTVALSVQIPEGIFSVTPQVHPGWDIAVETEALAAPVEQEEGEAITERMSVVTFTAQPGNELPDDFRDQFTIGYQAPDAPGEYLFFKTIQTCTGGTETAWVEEYTGEGEEPEHPSPAVLLTEASGGGHGGEEAAEDTEMTGTTEVAGDPVSDSDTDTDDDSSSDTLAVVALVVGVLGLGLGGAALAKSRKA